MAQPPGPPFWTLNASGLTGGSNKADLAGCHIAQNAQGVYTFYDPSWDVLGTFSGTPLTCTFNYDGIDGWIITLATAISGRNANGTWSTPKTPKAGPEEIPAQSGDYTAQSGGSVDAEAASSAGYGTR
jgi:hypothetical protein